MFRERAGRTRHIRQLPVVQRLRVDLYKTSSSGHGEALDAMASKAEGLEPLPYMGVHAATARDLCRRPMDETFNWYCACAGKRSTLRKNCLFS